jgi:glucosamine-6-phosphate deaminase
MKLIIVDNMEDLGSTAARLVCEYLAENPTAALVFPTGNTPLGMYERLVEHYHAGRVDFSRAALIELDDYFGITADDPRCLYTWLERIFLRLVNFAGDRVIRFDTAAIDPEREAQRMADTTATLGGIGLSVLGLGPNGHIGFNEPGASLDSPTRVVELTRASIKSNSEYWGAGAKVPARGITLGMDLLLKAQKTILLVSGRHKAQILRQLVLGEETSELPASFLMRNSELTIIADKAATTLL